MEQVIITILKRFLVVVLRHLRHQIYYILLAHPIVNVVTVKYCFRKEGDIIHIQKWSRLSVKGTKVLLSSDITKRNIKQVSDNFKLDRMVFQS